MENPTMKQLKEMGKEFIKDELQNNEGVALTDEQIDEIVNTLHSITNETGEEPKYFPYNVLNKEEQLLKGEALVEVDPVTGLRRIVGVAGAPEKKISFTDIIEGNEDEEMNKITKDQSKVLSDFGLSDDESMELFKVITKFQAGEKFNIYNELPETVKDMIKNTTMSNNPKVLSEAAKNMIAFFINQLNIEKEFIDLQDSIKKELDMPGIADIYADHLVQAMEKDIIEKANSLEEAGEIEKASKLRAISNTYTDTYKMTLEYLELDNNPKIVKKIAKDLKKFNKHCMEFNFKYQDSKFKIKDVKLLLPCLTRHLEYNEIDVKKFILLFINICKNMTSKDILEHTFMYYTITNILTIDHIEKDSEFKDTILENVKSVIDKIKLIEEGVR